ncbi:MAG: hypothetical protein J6J33_04255, partial [Clostridia bacterium]|nr:hypothetical protein [Clostridia bacterium]
WFSAGKFIVPVYLDKDDTNGKYSVTQDADDSYDKVFYMSFNPMLSNGSTTRRIKVKATPSAGNVSFLRSNANTPSNYEGAISYPDTTVRGEAVYSSLVTYNAYKLNFKSYAINSSTVDYGELKYDNTRFYFYEIGTTYTQELPIPDQDTILTSLTGCFPVGKLVEVSRELYSNDYAFQSWSANQKSLNTLALSHTFPSGVTVDNYPDVENVSGGLSCVFGAVEDSTIYPINSYTDNNAAYNEASRTHAEYYNNRVGTLAVTSQKSYNNYTFYGNFLKVKNFILSGTVYDADKLLNSPNAIMSGVTINIYSASGNIITGGGITSSITNGVYTIKGLQYGNYVIFTNGNYKFYGSDVTELQDINGNDVKRVLKNTVVGDSVKISAKVVQAFGHTYYLKYNESTFVYGNKPYYVSGNTVFDKGGNPVGGCTVKYIYKTLDLTTSSILASEYNDDSSVVVNVSVLGSTQDSLEDPANYGISYEIIKSVTNYNSSTGLETTTVYASIVLPSDRSIEAYNLVTDNSLGIQVYQNANDSRNTIISRKELVGKEKVLKYYSLTQDSLSGSEYMRSADGSFIKYGNEYFVYQYTNFSGIDNQIYQSVSSNDIISYKGGATLFELDELHYSSKSSSRDYLYSSIYMGDNGQYLAYLIYNGQAYFCSEQMVRTGGDLDFVVSYTETAAHTSGSANYSNIIVYESNNESYFANQASKPTSFKYNGEEVSGITTYGAPLDTHFYSVNLIKDETLETKSEGSERGFKQESKVFNLAESQFLTTGDVSVTYYTFYYCDILYFLKSSAAETGIYAKLDTFTGEFSQEVSAEFGFTNISIDRSRLTITFTRDVLTYGKTDFYLYRHEDGVSYQFYADFYCGKETDLVEELGLAKVQVTNSGVTLYRYCMDDQYYINTNSDVIYTDFECTIPWRYNDTYSIKKVAADSYKVTISNNFRTYIKFTTSASKTYYLINKDLTVYEKPGSTFNELVEAYYIRIRKNDSKSGTYQLDYEFGSSMITNYGGGSISKSQVLNGSTITGAEITVGIDANNFKKDYFGISQTSIVSQTYLTNMTLSAFMYNDKFLYVKDDGELHLYTDDIFSSETKVANKYFGSFENSVAANKSDKLYNITHLTTNYYFDTRSNLNTNSSSRYQVYALYTDAQMSNTYSLTSLNFSYYIVYHLDTSKYYLAEAVTLSHDYSFTHNSRTYYVDPFTTFGTDIQVLYKDLDLKYNSTDAEDDWKFYAKDTSPVNLDNYFNFNALYFAQGTLLLFTELDSNSTNELFGATGLMNAYVIGSGSPSKYRIEITNPISIAGELYQIHDDTDNAKDVNLNCAESLDSMCYVYYGVDKYNGKYYNTNPVGKFVATYDTQGNNIGVQSYTEGGHTTYGEYTYFYGLTNFKTLLDGGYIKLGKDITEATNAAFFNLCGPKLISNYFYYVKDLGDASSTTYVFQEEFNSSNGQVVINEQSFTYAINGTYKDIDDVEHTVSANNPHTGKVYIKNNYVYRTEIKDGMTKINDLSGWTTNINDDYKTTASPVEEVTGGWIYKTDDYGYFFKMESNAPGKTYSLYLSYNADEDTLTSPLNFTVITINEVGSLPTLGQTTTPVRVYYNYLSYAPGNGSGYLLAEDGTKFHFINNSTGKYALVANLTSDPSPWMSEENNVDVNGD